MSTATVDVITSTGPALAEIQAHVDREIDDLLASLPDPAQLSAGGAARHHRPLRRGARGKLHLLDDRRLHRGRIGRGAREDHRQPPRGNPRLPSGDDAALRDRGAGGADRARRGGGVSQPDRRPPLHRTAGGRTDRRDDGVLRRLHPALHGLPGGSRAAGRARRRWNTPTSTASATSRTPRSCSARSTPSWRSRRRCRREDVFEGVGLLRTLIQTIVVSN